jgi:predicted small metal-binding protein
MKTLHCNQMIPECNHVSTGADENEVVENAAAHIQEQHMDMLNALEGGDIDAIKPNLHMLVGDE